MAGSSSSSANKFLSNTTIFIHSQGIPQPRLNVFDRQINNYGGVLTKNYKHPKLDILLISEQFTGKLHLCKLPEVAKNVRIATVDWLCACLKVKQFLDIDKFLVQSVDSDDCESRKRHTGQEESVDLAKRTKSVGKTSATAPDYLCQRASTTGDQSTTACNVQIIQELEKLRDVYKASNDTWRIFSYDRAISALSHCGKEITTKEEALALPGIGESMARKVLEIRENGILSKARELTSDEKSSTLATFCEIWGCGPSTAENWWQIGLRSIDDLKTSKGKALLNAQQQIGLKYLEEFKKRIPRMEVEQFGELIKATVSSLFKDENIETILVGSYRRGKTTCGDIDILLLTESHLPRDRVLENLLHTLRKNGVITDDLTCTESRGQHKYLGVARLPSSNTSDVETNFYLHRRLDLFVASQLESATALLHYTGSALFNRSIRLLAARKNMMLTEHALFTNTIRQGQEVLHDGTKIPTKTEEDIFRLLDIEYRPPTERDH